MGLDRISIRNLIIPFNEVLPPGTLKLLREQFDVSEHTPAKVLRGEFTNLEITTEALRQVLAHLDLLERFIDQFPAEIIIHLKKSLMDEAIV